MDHNKNIFQKYECHNSSLNLIKTHLILHKPGFEFHKMYLPHNSTPKGHIPSLAYFHLHERLLGHNHHDNHSCSLDIFRSSSFSLFRVVDQPHNHDNHILCFQDMFDLKDTWRNCIIIEESFSPKLIVSLHEPYPFLPSGQ